MKSVNEAAQIIAERAEALAQAAAAQTSAESEQAAMVGAVHAIAETLRSESAPDPSLFTPLHDQPAIASRLHWGVAWACIEKLNELLHPNGAQEIAKRIRGVAREVAESDRALSPPAVASGGSDSGATLRASISRLGGSVVTLHPSGALCFGSDEEAKTLGIHNEVGRTCRSLYEFFAPETATQCEQAVASGKPWQINGSYFDDSSHRCAARFAGTPMGPSGSALHEIIVLPSREVRSSSPAEREYTSLLKHIPIGIISAGKDGAILRANRRAAAMMGSGEASRLEGQSVGAVLGDSDSLSRKAIDLALNKGKEGRVRLVGKTPFGITLDCDLVVTPQHDAAGEVTGVEVFLVDAPEQTALSRSLLHTEKLSALGEIVGGVAHELNNPLTGILGYAQLLQSMDLDEKTRSRLEQISLEAQRCRKIVQGLLGFSRHYEAEKVVTGLNEVISDVVALREYQIRVDAIEVALDLTRSLPRVEIDPHEMQRVFLNIINNAHYALLKVDDRPRRFTIRSWESNGDACVSFEDNGPGIPLEDQTRIFNPFFTTKDVGEGTGLGLSVAYGVVRDHGGRIDLESKVGEGATFTVVLPISETPEQGDGEAKPTD